MGIAGDLLAGIKTLWQAEASLAAFGGPYSDEEPPDDSPAFPYVVVTTPTSDRESTSNRGEYWRTSVEWSIYDTTREACEGHIKTLRAVFDVQLPALSPSDGHVLMAKCVSDNVRKEDKEVYRAVVLYEYRRRKPRADV